MAGEPAPRCMKHSSCAPPVTTRQTFGSAERTLSPLEMPHKASSPFAALFSDGVSPSIRSEDEKANRGLDLMQVERLRQICAVGEPSKQQGAGSRMLRLQRTVPKWDLGPLELLIARYQRALALELDRLSRGQATSTQPTPWP